MKTLLHAWLWVLAIVWAVYTVFAGYVQWTMVFGNTPMLEAYRALFFVGAPMFVISISVTVVLHPELRREAAKNIKTYFWR